MNILVVGSGGREHAILLKLKESESVEKLYCLPGNAGTKDIAKNIDLKVTQYDEITNICKEKSIDLVVVGPEDPLTEGITDILEDAGVRVFGPSKEAAQIEGSKAFSKKLMEKYNIPTAKFKTFKNYESAIEYLRCHDIPVVIKASGNAAGKGAVICKSMQEAENTLEEIMVKKVFGEAGNEVVIEEFMTGEEASIFAVTDGKYYKILAPAQDHKAVYDGGKGPNTGGMGTYAPAPVIDNAMLKIIEDEIIAPTFDAMRKENKTYKGVLFIGLMITKSGPKVIEYNCRFGDPETQVVLPLYDGDLAELLYSSAVNGFDKNELLPIKKEHTVCLVLASGGYPASYEKGYEITGLDKMTDGCYAIHAGTKEDNDKIITSGGRVLGIIAKSNTLADAIEKVYKQTEIVKFEKAYFRTDIGKKGLKYYQ